MKRNESNTTSGLLRRVGSLGKRLFATLLVTGALSIGLHSAANAQWVQGATNTDLAFQFPLGHVAIGVPFPAPYAGIKQFYVIGSSQFDGSMIVNNGPVDFFSPFNLRPTGGIANKMWFYSDNGTNFSSFSNGASTVNMSYTWPSAAPLAGQVLSSTAGGSMSWVTAGTGNVTGAGTIQTIPMWSGSPTNLANSVITQNGAASTMINVPGYPFAPATDVLQSAGSTRVGSVAVGPALPVGSVQGSPLFFSGVPGLFAPAADGNNTDPLAIYRQNNAYDNTELRISIGDNPEGIPDPIGANTPDRFAIGASPTFGPLAGTFQAGFSYSTANGLALGFGVPNLNGLDVGSTPAFLGSTVVPSANVAIGAYAGVNVAPANGLIVSGKTGLGIVLPTNQLEVSTGGGVNNISGLSLTQFQAPVVPQAPNGMCLSADLATGKIILTTAGGAGGLGPALQNYVARWNTTTTITNGGIYDDGTGPIGIGTFSATPANNLSFAAGAGTSPSALKIGIERTTVASANGTPLKEVAGAAVSGGTNLIGGDLTLSGGVSTGSGSSNIIFQVAAAGASGTTDRTPATKMELTGAGKLGLGTTTPSTDLAFDGSAARTIGMESAATGKPLTVQGGSSNTTAGGTPHNGGDLNLSGGKGYGTGSSNINLTTYVGTTATTVISVVGSGQFVGINNTSPGVALDVVGDYNGTGNITIAGTGTSTGGSWVSDIRLKKNVTEMTNSLQRVMLLRPVEYDFRQSEFPQFTFPHEHQIGFIAQEMEKVVPEVVHDCVQGAEAGFKSMSYQNLTALLAGAIKEQQNEIVLDDSALTVAHATISDLTTRVAKLESELGKLLGQNNGSLGGTAAPNRVSFFQNNPNPFKDITTISFTIPESVTKADLVVVNAGSNTEALRIPIGMRGTGSIEVSASSLNSGQYLYSIIADGQQAPAKKMTVLK